MREAGVKIRYVRQKDFQAAAEYVREHRRRNRRYTFELEEREVTKWTTIEVEEEHDE
jgi:hypothetical protein